MGGELENPTYEQISRGGTDHIEVVQIEYDDSQISYEQLLEIFWRNIDPFAVNRQFCDSGDQYRSAIFYHDEGQKASAEDVIKEVNGAKLWSDPIVTEVTPLETFFVAEEYHQDYFKRNPSQPYCLAMITPKVAKLRKEYVSRLKRQTA